MSDNGPITRDHIEQKFRAIQSEVVGVETEARSYAVLAAAAVTVTVVILAFALGSRRGRGRRSFVEVRRL